MAGQTGGWTESLLNRQMVRQRWLDRQMGEQTDGWTDRWLNTDG